MENGKCGDLEKLRAIAESKGLCRRDASFKDRIDLAIQNLEIREILEIEPPRVNDLTSCLPVQGSGKVYAIRYDLTRGVDNHKKLVVACLILRQILLGNLPSKKKETLIDGGNVNTAKAVAYYVHKFGLHGIHVMSRHFPEDIIAGLETGRFHIICARKNKKLSPEREFYSYLFELMKKPSFCNALCLWHAKHGGEVIYPIGREIVRELPSNLEISVSCIGAGSTLEGVQLSINDYFAYTGTKPLYVFIAEHEMSPLFAREFTDKVQEVKPLEKLPHDEKFRKIKGFPHFVNGPHYVDRNPLIKQAVLQRIDGIVQYSEDEWKGIHNYLEERGISVGNSSAANLGVAVRLANEGRKVLTFIFEPFREFYKKQRKSRV